MKHHAPTFVLSGLAALLFGSAVVGAPMPEAAHAGEHANEGWLIPSFSGLQVPPHVIRDVFTPARKQELIEKVTEAMVAVEGENMRGVTWVKINEVASGDYGRSAESG